MAKEFDIELAYWKDEQGFTNSEVYEQIEEGYDFDEVVKNYRSEWSDDRECRGYDDVEIRVVDEDGYVLDKAWLFNK